MVFNKKERKYEIDGEEKPEKKRNTVGGTWM
ncbi:uncharacterized protein G2W53_031163 [Senna tora]|uniref:Uncharacterized protein n=1 Tax=Senna tora TaxID=362788 RepID=A0A834T7U8_9FABA|nr:uncharacterized protein G2W53_031163 [Senna tora]